MKDLKRIERLEQAFFTGTSHPVEVGEIYSGVSATYEEYGVGVERAYTWDAASRAAQNAAFIENEKKLEEAATAWAAEVLPRIVEDENGKKTEVPHELPPVEEARDSAEYFAKQMGADKAAVVAKANETLDFYSRH